LESADEGWLVAVSEFATASLYLVLMSRIFFCLTQGLLLLTAAGKLAGAVHWEVELTLADPLLNFIGARQMLVCTAMTELGVAL
jgi:hypothetical protein